MMKNAWWMTWSHLIFPNICRSYTEKCDIYSLGVLFIALRTGQHYWHPESCEDEQGAEVARSLLTEESTQIQDGVANLDRTQQCFFLMILIWLIWRSNIQKTNMFECLSPPDGQSIWEYFWGHTNCELFCHFIKGYLIACGKPAGHREVAPREFDVHFRWTPGREAEEK